MAAHAPIDCAQTLNAQLTCTVDACVRGCCYLAHTHMGHSHTSHVHTWGSSTHSTRGNFPHKKHMRGSHTSYPGRVGQVVAVAKPLFIIGGDKRELQRELCERRARRLKRVSEEAACKDVFE